MSLLKYRLEWEECNLCHPGTGIPPNRRNLPSRQGFLRGDLPVWAESAEAAARTFIRCGEPRSRVRVTGCVQEGL